MTDYRKLTKFQQEQVDKRINESIEPGHNRNSHNGFEWDEPVYTLENVHNGWYCADCLMIHYNCVCSHED